MKQLLLIPFLLSLSCTNHNEQVALPSVPTGDTLLLLDNFESNSLQKDIILNHARSSFIQGNSRALKVEFLSKDNLHASLMLKPQQPYDWSQYSDFNIAFDIANSGQHSVQLFLDITDKHGANYTRSVSIPVGVEKTYYAKLSGHDLATPEGRGDIELNFLSGLRNNPETWESEDVQFISLWGKKNLDVSGIAKIELSVQYALFDKEVSIDNIRLRKNPEQNQQFLSAIVDKFGQNAKQNYPGKVHSLEELVAARQQEARDLHGELFSERSKFSGWEKGPKQEGTGYFTTAKVNGKWSFIDPEGYPYFATGLDIIRLGDAATMTGYDLTEPGIRSGRHVALEKRANMFEWLPKEGDPLTKHFGYIGNNHSGALKKGETFNFQRANLERKYGDNYEEKWLDTTVDRMLDWGFTSLGNWTSPKLYSNNKIPYFANGWIRGKFKTVSSGQDFWGALPDVFDPEFALSAEQTARRVAAEVNNSPWCVGVFIDNEKSFGRSETKNSIYGIVINTLTRDGRDVPTKAHFTKMMKAKYATIDALNQAWEKNIASWQAFEKGVDSSLVNQVQEADYSAMLYAYSEKYFSTVNQAVKKYMPNHLYLGARFPVWGMPMEAVKASAKHVDVISFNAYKEGLIAKQWDFLSELDMPAIIGEFHMGAMDRGMFHSGIVIASDQNDRAKMFKDYLHSAIDHPNFIGAHYFQYADGPLTGRAYDGENYNIGFISVTDTPYTEMVEAAKSLNKELYPRRFAE
ncbi:beta-galactosidase [Paraglaciecola aquimarina]|uniref:Beta-galactosidase n=1 Tax=Paraglaciecola aquimarina TaxID=1235557 RepID=A0ABU3SY38_9ALTE|nr:beta-galactosidase [Paraglaciecola aquimarina]MDU0354929.1 beta-galactosidase [Paraglaciecola aquimarina]